MTKPAPSFGEIESALDRGKLEMVTPWGAWVLVRRRGNTVRRERGHQEVPVFMENEVEANIATTSASLGYPDVRIVS